MPKSRGGGGCTVGEGGSGGGGRKCTVGGQAGCVLRIEVIVKMPQKNTKSRGVRSEFGGSGCEVVYGRQRIEVIVKMQKQVGGIRSGWRSEWIG